MNLVFRRLQFFILFGIVACNLVACNTAPSNPTPNPNALTVIISSPTGTAYTNGTLNLQIVVSNGTPESVELLKGEEILVSNLAAPYTYAWNTSSEAEGSYTLKARAKRGTEVFESEKAVTVIVDRTAPTISERTPAPGADNILYSAPITIKFSEPMLASTVTSANLQLVANSLPVPLTPSLAADGLTLTLQAAEGGLTEFDTQSELTLSKLTDKAGNELSSSSWAWKLPSWLTVGGVRVNDLEDSHRVFSDRDGLELDTSDHPVVVVNEIAESAGDKGLIYVKQWTGTQWQRLGENLIEGNGSGETFHALALDSSGNPTVAFNDATDGLSKVRVVRWDGSAWGAVGPGSLNQNPERTAFPTSLSIDTSGNPVLAFIEYTNQVSPVKIQLYVKRWTGSSWELLGSGSLNQNTDFSALNEVSLALDASGNPVVTWSEREIDDTKNDAIAIYVKRWTGTQWQLLGSGKLNSQPVGYSPSLALDASSQPVVAYVERTGSNPGSVYVQKFDGTNWKYVGSIINPVSALQENVGYVSLALDNAARPVVNYTVNNNGTDSYYKRFDGTNWQTFVKPIPDVIFARSLVLDSEGHPFIAVTKEITQPFSEFASVLQANH
jgi:Bacterial Ig-like domain/Bacterial Ig domain